MKNKITYPIFAFLVVLLASASFSASVQAAPNESFSTGDWFYFDSTSERQSYWENLMILSNDTGTNLYQWNEHWNEDFTTTEGDLELFLIKPDVNLPLFTDPEFGDYDHIMLVEFSGMSVDPSNKTGGEKLFDAGPPLSGTWKNKTYPVENTAGWMEGDGKDDEEFMPLVSNSTYLIQMPEMLDNQMNFTEMEWFKQGPDGGMDFGAFDGLVPLIDRGISYNPAEVFFINGADRTLATNFVWQTFSVSYTEDFVTRIPFGDPNNPDSWVEMNATVDLWVDYYYDYTFDAATGMLLEIWEESDWYIDISYSNDSYSPPPPPTALGLDQGEGPSSFSIDFSNYVEGSSWIEHSISEASSFYGNARPTSSGTNRLQRGDLLVYEVDSEEEWWMDSEVIVGNPDLLGWESYDSSWGDHYSYGELNFDVYRHQPGSFEAVMFSEGISEGSWGYDSSGTHFGKYEEESNSESMPARSYLSFEAMNFQSTDDEEIVHWFEDSMWFNDDFLYDDGPDSDGWRLDYNRELPMVGVVNDTTWHVDTEVGESVWINDFEHTWFNVQQYSQKYGTSYNQQVEIPLFRDENGEAWITVTLTGEARGEQGFYYDNQTGVLVRMEERMEIDLFLNGTGTFEYWDDADNKHTLTATFDAAISIREKFSIMLTEHPHVYLTAEAADPVDHSTPLDTTPVDSDTTSEAAPGLDLPISVPSVVMGIIAIPVVLRFKKKLR